MGATPDQKGRHGGRATGLCESTPVEHDNRQLLISERHELVTPGEESVSDYNFVMRCWERDELNTLLARHRFRVLSCFGAYDPGVAAGSTDRLVVVAQRVGAAA